MNKIKALPIICAYLILSISVILCFILCWSIYLYLPPNDFRAIITTCVGIPFYFLCGLIVFRMFFIFFPIKAGEIRADSREDFLSNIHICYLLVLFDPIFKNPLLPVFVTTPLYQLLGAKIGKNTYSNGVILDPYFVTVGNNTILGMECLLIPHALEGSRLAYYPIKIGDNVTIGTRAIIHAGVTIENGAIVGSGAVVTKNKHIGENEIWGGVPAKYIKKRDEV